MKHVISPNPHPVGTEAARAWEEGYWRGRRDLVEQQDGACTCTLHVDGALEVVEGCPQHRSKAVEQ